MLLPIQSLPALMHWYDDLWVSSGASNLDEEPYENDNKQYHGESDAGTSAKDSSVRSPIAPLSPSICPEINMKII